MDDIKMDLGEIEWDAMDWSDLVQVREKWRVFVNIAKSFWAP
jgi:hypothetical protein